MLINRINIVVLIATLIGCKNTCSNCDLVNNSTCQEIVQIDAASKSKRYLLIPLNGCSSCIDRTVGFLKQNTSTLLNKNFLVIFTGLTDDDKYNRSRMRGLSDGLYTIETGDKFNELFVSNETPIYFELNDKRIVYCQHILTNEDLLHLLD